MSERVIRLHVIATAAHKGKALELDCERETVTIRGARGDKLGTVTWGSLIEQVGSTHDAGRMVDAREQPRISLVFNVRYRTSTGKSLESRAGGIGGGGLFIESTAPLPVGTDLTMEFFLPDRPTERMEAKGTVAWVCPKSDQYTFSQGMGVRFTDISAQTRARIVDFVNEYKRNL
jgi:type IV pilus assembly protein PilZ